ncbi:MAG: hypothetical protein AAGF12_09245 [Myxococcota bacterium]
MERPAFRILTAVALLLILGGADSCGVDSENRDVGDPCTRTRECPGVLECRGGICQPPLDASPDADADASDADGSE